MPAPLSVRPLPALRAIACLLLTLVLTTGCVTTGLPVASTSPWQRQTLDTAGNPPGRGLQR